jgi:hypothetical protein
MSNKINDETLERLYQDAIADDERGLLEVKIRDMVLRYGLHQDDDRDEILQLIAEDEFYEQFT